MAYELAASRSVLLLGAEPQPGRHSTARSAAAWIPGHGVDVVRALITASGPRFGLLAAELDAPPLLCPRPVLWIATDDDSECAVAAMRAERAGEPDAPVLLDPAQAQVRSPALAPGVVRAAGLTEGAADVDTDALHRAYLCGLGAGGCSSGPLCTRSPAMARAGGSPPVTPSSRRVTS